MSLKLLPILGVPSLPSFLDRGPFCLGLPSLPNSARWLDGGDNGLFAAEDGAGASLPDAEVVIDDASVVACDCWSIDFCRMGGVGLVRSACRTFCSGLELVRKSVSCAYFVLVGRLAADAKGKLGAPCEPVSSISCGPSPSSNVDSSRGRCCLKRGGRLNS
jgi:hypothetical protein